MRPGWRQLVLADATANYLVEACSRVELSAIMLAYVRARAGEAVITAIASAEPIRIDVALQPSVVRLIRKKRQ